MMEKCFDPFWQETCPCLWNSKSFSLNSKFTSNILWNSIHPYLSFLKMWMNVSRIMVVVYIFVKMRLENTDVSAKLVTDSWAMVIAVKVRLNILYTWIISFKCNTILFVHSAYNLGTSTKGGFLHKIREVVICSHQFTIWEIISL
jgi:hypothetical protein